MTAPGSLPEAQFADARGLFQSLKTEALRENKRRNLDLLWQVLQEMWRAGHRDYGLASVGRKLAAVGGPKTQSLRNEGGRDFRRVIEAFAACAGAQARAKLVKGQSQLDIAVESLPDPAVRAMFRQIVAENKLYRSQNDQLRSAFKALSVRRSEDASPAHEPQQIVTVPELTALEKEVLKKSFSPERFEENGWRISAGGGVVDDAGVSVLSPSFMSIMVKLFE